MSSTLVITLVVVAAVAWLSFLGVSALRARGKEEVAPNLKPGITDDELETRRLERYQQAAVLFSAFLAIALPLYYLGESHRQDVFAQQFSNESVQRGADLVVQYKCFGCHGPNGVGGAAPFVEERTGVNVTWKAPSLNDVFFRYDVSEVTYWVTYGRGNTPMPPWGLAGGGPLSEHQVADVVNYLQTIQITQDQELAKVEQQVQTGLQVLAGADAATQQAILQQRQLIADMEASTARQPEIQKLADAAAAALAAGKQGIDTDGDGLSDTAETTISDLTHQAAKVFAAPGLTALTFDPKNPQTNGEPDRQVAEQAVANLEKLAAGPYPILTTNAEAARQALTATGPDEDGDGLSDDAEKTLTAQFADAVSKVKPGRLEVVTLDPTKKESVAGTSDAVTAEQAVGALESLALSTKIQADNLAKSLPAAQAGLQKLLQYQQEKQWAVDFQGVADAAFGGNVDQAKRAVGLFLGYCARCHTSDFSAGPPYAQAPGSGGLGPALWHGRERVQFQSKEDLEAFLEVGAVANKPYGVNGMGSGRMPAFGESLSKDDLMTLATYLYSGNLDGKG